MNYRPSWHEFWFMQAMIYSTRATCDRLRTACILVQDKRIIGAGYNGSPPGLPHCDDVGHLIIDSHCERTLHAEVNALRLAQLNQTPVKGCTAYVLNTPCIRCAHHLVTAGVKEVFFLQGYNSRGLAYLQQLAQGSGVPFVQLELDPHQLLNDAINILRGPGGILSQK